MSIQSPGDLKGMQHVGRIVARTIQEMRASVRIGMRTAELDAVAASVFARAGAYSAPQRVYGFPGTTCISVNDEIVHGVPGSRRLQPGDVLKIDVTAESNGYEWEAKQSGFSVVRELCGHGVGRRIHEAPQVPNHENRFSRDMLTDGLVIAIEPMLTEKPSHAIDTSDGWTIRTNNGALAVHEEHTVVITRGVPLTLTAAA